MDVFLDGNSKLRVSSASNVDAEIYSKLEKSCMDFAYDTFVELKEKQMQQNEESFKKYMYALELRQEAAEHIGIENIRRSRLQKLQKEKANIEHYFNIGAYVRLIEDFESDLYEGAVVPIALAQKYTAISLQPGGKILDVLAQTAIKQ